MEIRKAKRSATKLRLLLTGPSGSGKTWGALQIAKGLGGRCVVIDTEEGSSDLYDTLTEFDVIDLRPPFSPERYIEAIKAAEAAGYEVIIVDSVTHCWNGAGGCLEILEDVAKAQFRGNTWSAFSVITPRWRAFVDKLLRSPAHVICTGRSKTETAQVDDHGKKKVAKLGMKLEARDGLEFEFTCVLDLIHDGHYATVSKDRTGLFAGDPKPISADTGKAIAAWLAGGVAREVAKPSAAAAPAPAKRPGWRDRVAAAMTVAELGQISDDADAAESAGKLSPDQRATLDEMIAARDEAIHGAEVQA
jgi:nucleoside-triphosphatase THEP1